MNIKLLKLITGEEVLVEIVESEVKHISINLPALMLVVQPSGNREKPFNTIVLPWANHASSELLSIKMEHIVFIADPVEELVSLYQETFNKILTPPEAKVIVR